MNKKSKKAYDKAMDYYEKGQINKALDICEIALSENLKNSAILNLKGLLLYQKGDLKEAVTVWKINKDFNNDNIAKNYIKDSLADEKRLEIYITAEIELKNLKIDSAINLLKKCAESDFNAIKVNTALGLCYQKKGDFKLAQEYINKALSLDVNSDTAKTIKRNLIAMGVYKKERKSYKRIIIKVIIICLIAISTYMTINILNDKKVVTKNEQIDKIEKLENNNKIDSEDIKSDEEEQIRTDSVNAGKYLNKDKLTILLQDKDLDGIYEEIKDFKLDSLNIEDKGMYRQAVDILKNEGVQSFYNKGITFFNEKSYESATIEFEKAYIYCGESYLKEHIMYYKATTSLKKAMDTVAVQEYEEYYNEYNNGVYTESVLYELALMTERIDKEKSRKYANQLVSNYPNSIYINEYINGIINN